MCMLVGPTCLVGPSKCLTLPNQRHGTRGGRCRFAVSWQLNQSCGVRAIRCSSRDVATAAGSDSERPKTVGSRRGRTVGSRRKSRRPAVPFHKLALSKIDGALILGDIWMFSATQMSTQLIETDDVTPMLALGVTVWLAVSALRGDYDYAERVDEEAPFLVGWSVVTAVLNACFSWALYTVLLLSVLSIMVSGNMLDAAPVLHIDAGAKVSPILEVQIALLITMTAWRGFYYGLREGLV